MIDDVRAVASFTDGWAGLPADCNGQSAPFTARGRSFEVDPNDVSTTAAACSPEGPSGDLGSVTSWGQAGDRSLYLLDDDDHVVFVVEPMGVPGCVIDVPPNGRRIAQPGEPGCVVER